MNIADYERIRQVLLDGGDSEVAKVVRVLDAVFRSPRFRPLEASWSRQKELSDLVAAGFPTPFARKFLNWADLDDELSETLDQLVGAADPVRLDRLDQRARLRFRNALLEIETCWRQIVHFLPFILMAALRRLRDDTLQTHVAQELAQALHYYNTFYGRFDTERQREADQLHLLVYLLRVFRKLRRSAGPEGSVLFGRGADQAEAGLADLFPERFDAVMRLLQQIRNRIVHGRVADRIASSSLADVAGLVKWCFLDVVGVLAPLSASFSLDYVVDLSVHPDHAEAEALEFAGAAGPEIARYRISPQPQIELLAFTRQRLYLIRRSKRIGAGSGEVLEPGDYLDLTPFMISDRLRQARPSPDAAERQLLFALQQYLEPVRQLLFSDLGGSGDHQRPSGAEDWEATRLLEQVQWFKDRIGQLTARIRLKTGAPIDLPALRALLWRVSREQLTSLMDVRLYDEFGTLRADAEKRDLRSVYDQDLFVEPQEGGQVAAFLASGKRGMLLVGGSGFGKSNLLIHHYLQTLQAGRLAVFLGARRFATASFHDALLDIVGREISRDWTSLANLDAYLEEHGQTLLIVVDALNEYSGPQGPLPLLAGMITAVAHDQALRRCKVLATCRSETWARFRQEYGDQPLAPEAFATDEGDAVRVGGFEDPERGRKLFESYQRFYDLDARPYEKLGNRLRALLAQPFMMALIAETYANRGRPADTPRIAMPADLDFFSIFARLTERKARDAQLLVPAAEGLRRETLPEAIRGFCRALADLLCTRLIEADDADSALDAVPLDVIDKRADMQEFVQARGGISALDAALQIGLVEQVRTQQRDPEGRVVDNLSLAFFHDQYAQYWLAAAYQRSILGWLDAKRLASPAELDELAGRIRHIVLRSVHAPILAGALDHWVQMNLVNFHRSRLDPIIPLLDRLTGDESAAVRFEVGRILSMLMLRGFLPARDVFGPVFAAGSQQLRLELVSVFVEFWPALPPSAVQALIDACDPEQDEASIDKLSDIFVLHMLEQPAQVVDYLEQAISPLSWTSIAEIPRLKRQMRFMGQLGIFGLMLSFDHPERQGALRRFFRSKYQIGIDLLTGESGPGLREIAYRPIRDRYVYRGLESWGEDQWRRFITYQPESQNARFFEPVDGVVQRDLLRELLPYLVELHNGDFAALSLEPGSPFRDLAIRMLDFRIMSVIGYNALLCLPAVLVRQPWAVAEALVMELIERRTRSTLFYGNLLLANLAYSDVNLAGPALSLMRDRIVPLLLSEGLLCDWSITFCIATLDVGSLWPIQSGILDQLFAAMDARNGPDNCPDINQMLYKLCLTHEVELGRRALDKLLAEQDRFLAPRWRNFSLTLMAAMLTRSPPTLHAAIRDSGAPESVITEARSHRSDELVLQSRLFPLQTDINRFVAWLYLHEPRLRRGVIAQFIGSLACGRDVTDFGVGVRRMAVTLMSVFLGDAPDRVPGGPLTVAEVEAGVAASRRRES